MLKLAEDAGLAHVTGVYKQDDGTGKGYSRHQIDRSKAN